MNDKTKNAAPEPEPVQPVAWMWQHDETGRMTYTHAGEDREQFKRDNDTYSLICPLYRSPPARTPMTEEQINTIYESLYDIGHTRFRVAFARAVEKWHGIGSKR